MTYSPHLSAYLHRAVTSRVQESFNSWGLYAARWIQKKWLFSPINFCAMYCSCAVGGVSSVAILKIWENRESLLREIRRRCDSNETRQPEEHDERFDWEGKSFVSYENILSKSDRIMVISKTLDDMYNQWFLRKRRKMFPKTLKGRSSWPSSYSLVQTLSLLSFFCSFFFLIIHLILKKSFYINLYFASYYLDRGRIKKRNNYSQPRNSPYTGANSVYGCSIYCHCSDPDYIFLTFATIHRGKFLSKCPRAR